MLEWLKLYHAPKSTTSFEKKTMQLGRLITKCHKKDLVLDHAHDK